MFRLPRVAYLIVLFLVFCTAPLGFTGSGTNEATLGPRALVMLIPIGAALYVARTGTSVDAKGIRIRALFGSKMLEWDQVRGLTVSDRSVYAVLDDGSLRLPCVHVNNLADVAKASGGRLPEIAEPKLKFAPSKRGR